MSADKNLAYARKLLDRLIEIDQTVVGHYYEMGRILSSINHGKLTELLGYESLAHLIEEELSFGTGTGYKYMNVYRHLRRLKYNKTEALELLDEFGITQLYAWLTRATTKASKRTIYSDLKSIGVPVTIGFCLKPDDRKRVTVLMDTMGAEWSEHGRLNNSSKLFMEMVAVCEEAYGIAEPAPKSKLTIVK